MLATAQRRKAYKSFPMEGAIANWYAKNTANDLPEFQADAYRVAARLKPGSRVLEVAPGPGYLAIALALQGEFHICGLDISRSFVRIASGNAGRAGVEIEFQQGDAAAMPYAADSFDFIVCRAAFKNFGDPEGALCEMRRVLKPGGEALIIDMRRDATDEAIDQRVADMNMSRMNAIFTRAVFKYSLRKRAYTKEYFQGSAAKLGFSSVRVDEEPLAMDVWLRN
jgi:ubiquinone/menaquinone biosynthesis C-methylase UbiE